VRVRARLCKLQTWCTRLAAAIDKVYQLLAHGRLFSPGISTTHDIAEILLKVALNTINQLNKITMRRRRQRPIFDINVIKCSEKTTPQFINLENQ
jgi:hypothetical protein